LVWNKSLSWYNGAFIRPCRLDRWRADGSLLGMKDRWMSRSEERGAGSASARLLAVYADLALLAHSGIAASQAPDALWTAAGPSLIEQMGWRVMTSSDASTGTMPGAAFVSSTR